jgi:hypothetical protein
MIQLEQEMKMASMENQPHKKASGVSDGHAYSGGDGSQPSGEGEKNQMQVLVRAAVEEKNRR